MNTFIPDYTAEFRDEQIRWFEEHMDKLPESMQINAYLRSPKLRFTVTALISTLRANKPSVVFAGYLDTLLQIKEKLIEQGIN